MSIENSKEFENYIIIYNLIKTIINNRIIRKPIQSDVRFHYL